MDQSHENSISEEREILVKGGQKALADLIALHQEKLERIVAFRLAPFLRSRVDPADVLLTIDGKPVRNIESLRTESPSRQLLPMDRYLTIMLFSSSGSTRLQERPAFRLAMATLRF